MFVDGDEAVITHYELDPDDRLLRRGRTEEWLTRQDTVALAATPAAAALIRQWARQTAEHGAIQDPDDELDTDQDVEPHHDTA